jgi:hypothetical protein
VIGSKMLIVPFALFTMGTSCGHPNIFEEPPRGGADAASLADCSADKILPAGASRVYIGLRNGNDGSGATMADARDGSTPAAFDTILRCYSEGCPDASNQQKYVAKTENLIVCLGPGTFSTLGSYDFIVGMPHGSAQGFTIGKGWKIHGAGRDKTTVKLSAYLPVTNAKNPLNLPVDTGVNLAFGTNSDDASGVEISDLTIDGNYPELKSHSRQHGIRALILDAIHLRSDLGGNWIHDVNVVNASAEVGAIDARFEAFPIWIASFSRGKVGVNHGNMIERVTMTKHFGDVCTAIAVANALAEVRNNLVDGYQIGYGGWDLGETVFHDNTATNTEYGFNIDSLVNNGVRIENNQIIHPRKYGFVVGGEGTFAKFKFVNNTVTIGKSGIIGFVFRGNVTEAVIIGNKLIADSRSGGSATAFRNYAANKQSGPNRDNFYQSNEIAGGMKLVFEAPSQKSQNCFFDNHDERGNPRKDLPNSHDGPCAPVSPPNPRPTPGSPISPNLATYLK